MPGASIGQQKGPNSPPEECLTAHRTMETSKVERIGLRSLASSAIFTWPLTKWLPLLQSILTNFCREMFPQLTGSSTCFQDLFKSQSMDFYAMGKTNLLLISKNMLILMVLILMNKDMFESRYAATAAAAKSLQSCPTLCDPRDCSPAGSPVPGILQARILEWVAISFSNVWKWKVKVKSLSRVQLLATPGTAAHQAPPSMGFSRQEYWSGVPLTSPESRDKDLKFMVWNHRYAWTNLILRGKENSLCHNLPPDYWCLSFFFFFP